MTVQRSRVVYRVMLIESRPTRWKVTGPSLLKVFRRKVEAVACGRGLARASYVGLGVLAQLVIHKRNGTIQEERTYGRDPKRYPG